MTKKYEFSCEHLKEKTISWGISGDARWCDKCKKWIYHRVDFSGHP